MTSTTKPTLKRLDEDSYSIMIGLMRLGTVSKAWSRLGGQGWIYSNEKNGDARISCTLTLPTRKFAVQQLLRRMASNETDHVRHERRIAHSIRNYRQK